MIPESIKLYPVCGSRDLTETEFKAYGEMRGIDIVLANRYLEWLNRRVDDKKEDKE